MSKQSIIIYNIPILFDILNEIKENIKNVLLDPKKEKEVIKGKES